MAWALLHALGASVSAGGLLWATWRGGGASSHAVRGICWAGAFAPVVPALERLFAYYLGLPMTMEEAAEAAEVTLTLTLRLSLTLTLTLTLALTLTRRRWLWAVTCPLARR